MVSLRGFLDAAFEGDTAVVGAGLSDDPSLANAVSDGSYYDKGISALHLAATGGIDNLLTCADPHELTPLLDRQPVSVVLLDILMPELRGDELLVQIRERHPDVAVIMVTASEEVELAVRCMKAGAHDYMVKAVEPNRLINGVRRAVEMWQLSCR